nr:MetQ/NlpA family ABC transporter substrate-binding protein [bacterium]
MKKYVSILLAALLATFAFAGCGKKSDTTIKVGASITPHAEILEQVKPILAEKGYTLEIVEFDDYVQPNLAVESGDLDANYFQHQPYLDNFNDERKTHLVSIAGIHYEPFALYAGKGKSLDDIQDGTIISVPNDGSNEARALYLLESLGLITLKENVGFTATVLDIATYNKKITIKELDAAQLTRTLPDVDFAIINGNYALQAGLKVSTDALAVEDKDSVAAKTYTNILVVKEGNEKNPALLALAEALQSDTIRDYINQTYNGSVIPTF